MIPVNQPVPRAMSRRAKTGRYETIRPSGRIERRERGVHVRSEAPKRRVIDRGRMRGLLPLARAWDYNGGEAGVV